MFPAEPTEMFWVSGIDVNDTFWLEVTLFSGNMKGFIDATSVGAMEQRVVRKSRTVRWTSINPLWFAAFTLQVAVLLVLGFTSLFLKAAGCLAVVHNESSLSMLLSPAMDEKAWPERRKAGVEEDSIFLNAHQTAGGVLVTANIQPKSQISSLRRLGEPRHRNSDLHRLEAMYTLKICKTSLDGVILKRYRR